MSEADMPPEGGAVSVEGAAALLAEAREGPPEVDLPEEEEAAPAPLPAPAAWDEDARVRFAELPADLQAVVARQEGARDEHVSTAVRAAADERARAQSDLALVQALSNQLSRVLPEVAETFRSRWGDDPDWQATAEMYGVDEAFRLKTQYELEQRQVAELGRHRGEAQRLARSKFLADESEKLKTLSPELAHPQTGAQARRQVGEWLSAQGATPAQLYDLGALEVSIARKAMLWDQAQAALKAPKGRLQPAPHVRPGAAAPDSAHTRAIDAASRRLSQTGSIEDAVALLKARRTA